MRRILVTGANKGIGLAIVRSILEHDETTFVYLGSRDRGRGDAAKAGLVEERAQWADRVQVVELDVASDASIQAAAAGLDGAGSLYAVVNNAGIASDELGPTLAVNAFGIHRVTQAFAGTIEPEGGRIVNVTSAAGPMFVARCSEERRRFLTDPRLEWSALEAFMSECLGLEGDEAGAAEAGLGNLQAYGLSKACANAYTLIAARQYPGLCVNACTPGYIETDLTRPWAESAGKSPEEMGMKSPAEGARSAIYLLFGELDGNGHYYGSDAVRSPLDRYRAPGDPPYRGD